MSPTLTLLCLFVLMLADMHCISAWRDLPLNSKKDAEQIVGDVLSAGYEKQTSRLLKDFDEELLKKHSESFATRKLNSDTSDFEDEVRNEAYDPKTKIWTITDQMLKDQEDDVQYFIEQVCTGDTLYFDTPRLITPKRPLHITRTISISGKVDGPLVVDGSIQKAKTKFMLTCPPYGNLLTASVPTFTIANTQFKDCKSKDNVVVLNSNCPDEVTKGVAWFIYVDFLNNEVVPGKRVLFANTGPDHQLVLQFVDVSSNICNGPECMYMSSINEIISVTVTKNSGELVDNDQSIFYMRKESVTNGSSVTGDSNKIRLFRIDSASKFTLKNSKISNTEPGQLKLEDKTYVKGGVLNACSSVVILMTTTITATSNCDAGAIRACCTSHLILRDCTFIENKAAISGGAVYIATKTTCEAFNTLFERNDAPFGGAIHAQQECKLYTTASTIVRNKGYTSGGGIYAYRKTEVTATDTNFEGNSAASGGAIAATEESTVAIIQSKCNLNFAKEGGAVHIMESSNLTVSTSNFTGNELLDIADEHKGALVEINCGGAINLQTHSKLKISSSRFEENTATNGGAVYIADKSNGIITNCEFIKGKAAGTFVKGSGGGIAINAFTTCNVEKCKFIGNMGQYGGAFSADTSSDMVLSKVTVAECNALSGGAAFVTGESNLKASESSFNKTHADDNGGAFDVEDSSTMKLTNVAVTYCTANFGGALYVKNSEATVEDSKFNGNEAKTLGDFLYSEQSKVIVDSTTVTNGVAGKTCGGICAFGDADATQGIMTYAAKSIKTK